MEAIRSPEKSVLTRATRRNIPEDGILHSHRLENLKSYIALTNWLRTVAEKMCFLWGMNWVFISQKAAFFTVAAVKTSDFI
jgi:hypothetical protein